MGTLLPGYSPLGVWHEDPTAPESYSGYGLANQLAAHMSFAEPAHLDRVRRFWDAPRLARRPGLKAVDLFDAVLDGISLSQLNSSKNPWLCPGFSPRPSPCGVVRAYSPEPPQSAVSLVFLLYQKGRDSRIFQAQDTGRALRPP
jgi:hypothetical protein